VFVIVISLLVFYTSALLLPSHLEKEYKLIQSTLRDTNSQIQAVSARIKRNRSKLENINGRLSSGTGKASYYHPRFEGRRMRYGEIYDDKSNSIACNILPANTIVLIENLKNNRIVVGVVRDTGNLYDRQFDLSESLMEKLDGLKDGVIEVQWLAVRKEM
jgi:rare lipoprotein A